VTVERKSAFLSADLSIYKTEEENASDVYTIYIIHKVSIAGGYLADHRVIESKCNGWQVFHLYDYLLDLLQDGYNQIDLRIIIFKNDEVLPMNCSEISHVFLMGLGCPEGSFNNETSFNNDTSTTSDQDESMESDHTLTDPFLVLKDERHKFLPILTLFGKEKKRRKRNTNFEKTSPLNRSIETERRRRCYRADKLEVIDSIEIDSEQHALLQPTSYNIGECKLDYNDGELPSEEVCVPTEFSSLEMLVTKEEQIFIHSNDDIIIEKCGFEAAAAISS